MPKKKKIPGDGPTAERMRQASVPLERRNIYDLIEDCIQRLENIRDMHHETERLRAKLLQKKPKKKKGKK